MKVDTFLLERNQSLYENQIKINLTESGMHPLSLRELLKPDELDALLDLPLGYGYTEGTPEARAAVAGWHAGARAENVLLTTGASEANLVALLAAVDPGDEIIVIVPNFMQIPGIGKAFGMSIRTVPLVEDGGWRIDRRALASALSSKTRMITLCNPNNPTGLILDEEDRTLLLNAASSHDAWLLVDEIYRGAELNGGAETRTFWGEDPRVIITGGLAKSFAHPGLRIGWVVAPETLISECMSRQDYTTIGSNTVGQFVTSRLLMPERRAAIFARSRTSLSRNLSVLSEWIQSRPRDMTLTPPQAGGMAFVRYAHRVSSTEFSRQLREQENVFVVAGDWFGLDGCVRIGIGGEEPLLREGLSRIGRFLDGLGR